MDSTDRQHRQIALLLQRADTMERIVSDHAGAYKLPAAAAVELEGAMCEFVQLNSALGRFYQGRGDILFHFTIKFHYMLHLAQLSRCMSPRLSWCYGGEDFMHRVKLLLQACQRGAPPDLVIRTAITKYANGLWMGLRAARSL